MVLRIIYRQQRCDVYTGLYCELRYWDTGSGVPKEILNEIADNMEAGFKCYLHRDTFELITFPDPDQYSDMETEVWKEEVRKIRKNKKKFIEPEKMMPANGS